MCLFLHVREATICATDNVNSNTKLLFLFVVVMNQLVGHVTFLNKAIVFCLFGHYSLTFDVCPRIKPDYHSLIFVLFDLIKLPLLFIDYDNDKLKISRW